MFLTATTNTFKPLQVHIIGGIFYLEHSSRDDGHNFELKSTKNMHIKKSKISKKSKWTFVHLHRLGIFSKIKRKSDTVQGPYIFVLLMWSDQ